MSFTWEKQENGSSILRRRKSSIVISRRGEDARGCWQIILFKPGYNPKEVFMPWVAEESQVKTYAERNMK